MTSATTKTAQLSEDDNSGIGSDAKDNDHNNDDDHRIVMSNGGNAWVTTKSTGTVTTSDVHVAATSASPSSVTHPLDKSIVSPPLLSESLDQSLTNDLASAMAYALNMPTAREITEVLQDLYILPDYRMANDDECYSDADDYSTSSSEYEYARRQQRASRTRRPSASAIYSSKAKKKSTSDTKVLVHRRRSRFRSNEAKKSTRVAADHRIRSSKDKASRKKAHQSPSLGKNNGDKLIGLRILMRKKDRNTKREVPKKKPVSKPFVKKTSFNNRNSPDKGKAVNSGFFIPGLSTTSMGLDASDADDLLPDIDDFITSYGMTVEKTIADIKSAVDAVKSADANDMAYAVLGRPSLPDIPPPERSNKKNKRNASSKHAASKSKKKGASRKAKNPPKIEVLGLNRPSSQPNDESRDGRGTKLVAWSQKKLKATSLVIKSAPSLRSKYGPSKPPGTMEALGSRHKMYRFKIGRRFDHASEAGDAGIAGITTSPRSFLRFGQQTNDSHDSCQHVSHSDHSDTTMKRRTRTPKPQENTPLPPQGAVNKAEVPVVGTDIDSDDEMINHRARITVTRPSSAMLPLDHDNNLLNISTDTPIGIGINCEAPLKPTDAPVESQASEEKGPCGTNEGNDDVPKAHRQVKSTIGTKWTNSTALVRSSLSRMQWRKIQQVPAPLGTCSATDADANATGVPSQMDGELLVKIAGLADELYDDSLSSSMSILRATKIIERYPENVERLVASLERRVKEKESAFTDVTMTAQTTPKKMAALLDLTSLTDGTEDTEDLSSPDTPLAMTIVGNVVEGLEKYGEAIENLFNAFGEAAEGEQGGRDSEGSSSFHGASVYRSSVRDDSMPLTSAGSSKATAGDHMSESPRRESKAHTRKFQGEKKMSAVVTTFGIMAAALATAAVALPKKGIARRRKKTESWQPIVADEGNEEEGLSECLPTQQTNTFAGAGENSVDPEESCFFENIEVRAAFVAESDDDVDEESPLEGIQFNVEEGLVGADPLASNHGPDASMPEEIGVEWNLSAVQLDEPTEDENQLDVGMNISLSSNGVEIYFDIGNDGVAANEILSNFENEHFLRELSAKLELYMRLEAICGKAETEEYAQRRLQAVLERFEGREQVVLLALRRQMELYMYTQPSIDDKTIAGMSETRNDNLSTESKPLVTKTKRIADQPTCTRIQEESKPSPSVESSNNGDIDLSTGDDIYEADISADLDHLLLDGPVEI